jgi:hypothetical protein
MVNVCTVSPSLHRGSHTGPVICHRRNSNVADIERNLRAKGPYLLCLNLGRERDREDEKHEIGAP